MKDITLTSTRQGFSVRIRCGAGQNPRFTIKLHDETAARARAQRMAELARMFVVAGLSTRAPGLLKAAGEQQTTADFECIYAQAREMCASAPLRDAPAATEETFEALARRWTSGKLAKEFPDHVKSKVTSDVDDQRLRVLYPVIGAVPLREFTVQHAKQAMAAVPEGRRPATRRHYAQLINRVLGLAVWPCEIIAHNPLPKGFLPRSGKKPAFSHLRPAEDQRLLGCTMVPLECRLLYGVLAREGMRLSEAMGLCWRHLDLKQGTVRLDVNKTGEPRVWALRADVARVLAALGDGQDGDERVFARAHDKAAKRFRAWLRTAGVSRPELFERTAARRPIRVHDLRATFITVGLAGGKSEAWICDRTGHKSSQMVNAYRRAARTANELGLGELQALDFCVPELCPKPKGEPRVNQELNRGKVSSDASARDDRGIDGTPDRIRTYDRWIRKPGLESDTPENTDGNAQAEPSHGPSLPVEVPYWFRGAPQASASVPPQSTVDQIARALESATQAGEWDVAKRLISILESLKAGATPPDGPDRKVIDLATRRGKGGGGGAP